MCVRHNSGVCWNPDCWAGSSQFDSANLKWGLTSVVNFNSQAMLTQAPHFANQRQTKKLERTLRVHRKDYLYQTLELIRILKVFSHNIDVKVVQGREGVLSQRDLCKWFFSNAVNPKEIHGETHKDFEKCICGSIISLDWKDRNSSKQKYISALCRYKEAANVNHFLWKSKKSQKIQPRA